jgi:hypothetical protein
VQIIIVLLIGPVNPIARAPALYSIELTVARLDTPNDKRGVFLQAVVVPGIDPPGVVDAGGTLSGVTHTARVIGKGMLLVVIVELLSACIHFLLLDKFFFFLFYFLFDGFYFLESVKFLFFFAKSFEFFI